VIAHARTGADVADFGLFFFVLWFTIHNRISDEAFATVL
jgi:hypothetical protein